MSPTQEFLVFSTFSFNVLGVLLVFYFESNDRLQKFPFEKKTSRFALQR